MQIPEGVVGQTIYAVRRRAKYVLIELDTGCLILHLGMSGHISIVNQGESIGVHDHVDFVLDHGLIFRLTDPRRFGSLHWQPHPAESHWLLADLGVEPLSDAFSAAYLIDQCRGRKVAIKNRIMDAKVVVGVGNIYANEALFRAGIRPRRAAGRVRRDLIARLVDAIKETLERAIDKGGTTINDFAATDGKPGYFSQELSVYGRAGEPCLVCSSNLKEIRLGGRSTVYCPSCQA